MTTAKERKPMEIPIPASEDDHPPPATKLRLMCSAGGQIVPRPHDKSLCYVGGETRMIVADRSSSLSDLRGKLSKTLLSGGGSGFFSLKYQLPSEDLDSLISVTSEEDLDNMIDEYDRSKPNRLRLFLFSSSSSDDWSDFLNAGGGSSSSSSAAVIPQKKLQEVQSVVQDSPMLENTSSSFGSTSSSPSPAIRAFAVEDQFSQIAVAENDDRYRKQPQNQSSLIAGAPDLASPDSISSDSSFGRTKPQFNDLISQISPANMNSNNSVYALPPATAYYQPVYYIHAGAPPPPPPPQQVYYAAAGYSPATGGYASRYAGAPPQQMYYAGAPPPTRNSQPL